MTFSDSIPWQSAYDRFRQAYPTGGLLLDLVALPNGQHNQYVVKALAQIGNLPIVSVLAEASDLSTAEAQACYKLCQILGLSPQASAPREELREEFREKLEIAPLPPVPHVVPQVVPQVVPKVVPPEKPAPSLPELTRSSPETVFEPIPTIAPEPRPSATPKSEPYRLSPSLSREAISPVSPTLPQGGDDWTEELAQIDLELRRLGWTIAEESAYLQEKYGKASRDHITDYGELLQFLTALQAMPVSYRGIETWNPHNPPPRYNHSPQMGLDRVSLNNISLNKDVSGVSQQAALPLEQPARIFEPNLNFSRDDMMEQIMAEIQRIGWGKRQGSEYLLRTYGAKTRQELRDDQLQEFLRYLQNQSLE